jgi:hypothetical protein
MSLAEQCAQALQRAQLLATETTARRTAERLNRLVEALSEATGVAEVAGVILDYAGGLGATAALVVEHDAHNQLTVLAAHGYPEPPPGWRSTLLTHWHTCCVPLNRCGGEPARQKPGRTGLSIPTGPLPVQVAVPLIWPPRCPTPVPPMTSP